MPLNLPERASYEFLKKLAKDRLATLRATDPTARLAAAQLAIAREYGFSSWRALKMDLERRVVRTSRSSGAHARSVMCTRWQSC